MSNVFIVNAASAIDGSTKDPSLCYQNLASTSLSVTPTHDVSNVGFVYDGMTTMKWRPVNTSSEIEFFGYFQNTDYIGISGVNWFSSGTSVTIRDAGDNVLGSSSGLRDNQPLLIFFEKQNYIRIKVQFSSANTSLEVGEISFGESMEFPRNVSVGYKPARWDINLRSSSNVTQNNQFGGSIIRPQSVTESFSINHVEIDFVETDYVNFLHSAIGLPVFFAWNKNNQHQAVYGHWESSQPSFESAYLSSVSFDIIGVA